MTENHPTVSPPQAQETDEEIVARLLSILKQRTIAAREWERQAGQWKESRDTAIKALFVQVARAQAAERQLGETQAAFGEAQETIAALQHAAHMPDDYKYGLPTWINMVLYAAYIGLDIGPHNRKWAVQMEERWESAMLQIRDAHNVLNAAGVPSEKHEPHEGCATQLGHRIRILLTNAEGGLTDKTTE